GQSLARLKAEQERNKRHPNGYAVRRLLEISCPAVGVERSIELADAWQRMQYAGAGIFRILQELRVDPRIRLLLFRPALFLKSRHVYRRDLLLADFLRGRMVPLEAELEVGAGKQRGLMRLIRGMIQGADRAIAGVEFATELLL